MPDSDAHVFTSTPLCFCAVCLPRLKVTPRSGNTASFFGSSPPGGVVDREETHLMNIQARIVSKFNCFIVYPHDDVYAAKLGVEQTASRREILEIYIYL